MNARRDRDKFIKKIKNSVCAFKGILTLFFFLDKHFSYKFNHDLLHAKTTHTHNDRKKGYNFQMYWNVYEHSREIYAFDVS